MAGLLEEKHLRRLLERAEDLRLFDLASLTAAVDAHPRAPGRGNPRRLLDENPGADEAASDLERDFLDLCRDHGIPRPRVNTPLHGYVVDFLWPAERLIVETDGRGTHSKDDAFESDRARDADLAVRGYHVIRFTHRHVTRQGRGTARIVKDLLAQRTPNSG